MWYDGNIPKRISREVPIMEHNPILKNPLSLDSEIPLYSQLMGIIKRSITSGALKVGDLLPSEAELCRSYDISRNTVRQAIGALEEEGFVVRKPVINRHPFPYRTNQRKNLMTGYLLFCS